MHSALAIETKDGKFLAVTPRLRLLRLEIMDRYLHAVASGDDNESRNQEQSLAFIDYLLLLESQTLRVAAQSINLANKRAG